MPQRIQRRRTKGWRMPVGAVYVGRPTKWGNPWAIADFPARGVPSEGYISMPERHRLVVDYFVRTLRLPGDEGINYPPTEEIQAELYGKDLVCWCPLDQPCHADVLLEVANR